MRGDHHHLLRTTTARWRGGYSQSGPRWEQRPPALLLLPSLPQRRCRSPLPPPFIHRPTDRRPAGTPRQLLLEKRCGAGAASGSTPPLLRVNMLRVGFAWRRRRRRWASSRFWVWGGNRQTVKELELPNSLAMHRRAESGGKPRRERAKQSGRCDAMPLPLPRWRAGRWAPPVCRFAVIFLSVFNLFIYLLLLY